MNGNLVRLLSPRLEEKTRLKQRQHIIENGIRGRRTLIWSPSSPSGRGTAKTPSIVPPLPYMGSAAPAPCPLSSSVTQLECFTKCPGEFRDDTVGTSTSTYGSVSLYVLRCTSRATRGWLSERRGTGGALAGGLGGRGDAGGGYLGGRGGAAGMLGSGVMRSQLENVSVDCEYRTYSVYANGCLIDDMQFVKSL